MYACVLVDEILSLNIDPIAIYLFPFNQLTNIYYKCIYVIHNIYGNTNRRRGVVFVKPNVLLARVI